MNTINIRKNLGNRGEALAAEYLRQGGYRVIARNYRAGHLEIDLIATRQKKLIFIEVKTRVKSAVGQADNMLSRKQTKNLKRALTAYCIKNRVSLDAAALDLIVIEVDRQNKRATLKHYRNVF